MIRQRSQFFPNSFYGILPSYNPDKMMKRNVNSLELPCWKQIDKERSKQENINHMNEKIALPTDVSGENSQK